MKMWIVAVHGGLAYLKARAYYIDVNGNLHFTDNESEPIACFVSGQWSCVIGEKYKIDNPPS